MCGIAARTRYEQVGVLYADDADRPLVVPRGAANYAFLGQLVELPEVVVFTVDYSVRDAMVAVYHHVGVDRAS